MVSSISALWMQLTTPYLVLSTPPAQNGKLCRMSIFDCVACRHVQPVGSVIGVADLQPGPKSQTRRARGWPVLLMAEQSVL